MNNRALRLLLEQADRHKFGPDAMASHFEALLADGAIQDLRARSSDRRPSAAVHPSPNATSTPASPEHPPSITATRASLANRLP